MFSLSFVIYELYINLVGKGRDRKLRPLQDGQATVRRKGDHPRAKHVPPREPEDHGGLPASPAAAHAGQGAGREAVLVQGQCVRRS